MLCSNLVLFRDTLSWYVSSKDYQFQVPKSNLNFACALDNSRHASSCPRGGDNVTWNLPAQAEKPRELAEQAPLLFPTMSASLLWISRFAEQPRSDTSKFFVTFNSRLIDLSDMSPIILKPTKNEIMNPLNVCINHNNKSPDSRSWAPPVAPVKFYQR